MAGLCKKRSASNIVLLGMAVLITVPLAWHNIADANFWFDESGQFWMARGLNHFSPPFSAEGSLYQVMLNNRQYNLDPGGFTLLLHYWSNVDCGPAWLRLLPFSFLVLTFYFLMLIVNELSRSALPAVAAATMASLLFPMALGYGFELRPYSMEVAGIVASLFFLMKAVHRPSRANLILLGLVCSFFLTSRYSFIIDIVSIAVVLFVFAFNRSLKDYVTRGGLFYVPVVCTALAIWFLSLSQQNAGGPTPVYVRGFVLYGKNLPEILQLIQTNFFSPRGLPSLVFMALFPLVKLTGWAHNGSLRQCRFSAVYLFVILFQAISILLSALDRYPWHIDTRWNLNLQAIAMLSFAMLVVLFFEYLRDKMIFRTNKPHLKIALILCLLLASVPGTNKKVHYSYDATYSYLASLSAEQMTNSRYFVGYYARPTVRYLFEYGPLKSRTDIYPHNFLFEEEQDFWKQAEINGTSLDIALISLVNEDGVNKYLRRFTSPFRIEAQQGLSYLLIKEGPR